MLFRKNDNDFVYIGGKKVEVRKLTVKEWRQVFGALNQLPGVLFSALTYGQKEMSALILAAVEICFDEVVSILAIASKLDKAYLEDNAALDEIVDYIEKLVAKNNLQETLKKLMTAGAKFLPKLNPEKADPQA
jgi:phosphatidylglycerophosphatase A